MVEIPSIDIPTAIAAVLVSLLGNYGKERFQRWRQDIAAGQRRQIDWYQEVIRIVRETQMTVEAGNAALAGYRGTVPDNEGEAIALLREQFAALDVDASQMDDDAIRELIDDNDIKEAVRTEVEDTLSDFQDEVEKEVQSAIREYHDELMGHLASCPFTLDEDVFGPIEQFLTFTFTQSLFPGLSQDDVDQVYELGDAVKQACDTKIDELE